jgi:CRP/FNR family transcriptional regulator
MVLRDLRCNQCPVRNHAICAALGGSNLNELADIMIHRHFHSGDEIFHQEETSQLFAVIVSGVVKLTRTFPDGREQIVGLLTTTHSLGDVYNGTSHNNVECVTDVELCCFKRTQFEAVLQRHPELERRLFNDVREDLNDAQDWLMVLGRMGAKEKLATFILWLCKDYGSHCVNVPGPESNPIIHLPFKREEIAGFLGMTIETVSRKFGSLVSIGFIRLIDSKTVEILDIEALREIAQSCDL